MRRRLVVALLDASHDGRADAAFRGEVLLQDPAAFPPCMQLPAHPGHHFAALAADVIARSLEAVPGMVLPRTRFLVHEPPSHRPPRWPAAPATEHFAPNRWFGATPSSSIGHAGPTSPQRAETKRWLAETEETRPAAI